MNKKDLNMTSNSNKDEEKNDSPSPTNDTTKLLEKIEALQIKQNLILQEEINLKN